MFGCWANVDIWIVDIWHSIEESAKGSQSRGLGGLGIEEEEARGLVGLSECPISLLF